MPRILSARDGIRLTPMHDGQKFVFQNRTKRNVVRCGRRWGKTTMFCKWAGDWALQGKSVGFFAPNYKLMRPSYDDLLRTLRPIVANASKLDSIIELKTGGAIEFWTLNDPDAGRSRKYHEVLIDEASLAPGLEALFEQSIAPTLLDFDGNATLGGTPKGIDEDSYFYQVCVNLSSKWRGFHAPTHSNPMLNAAAVAKLKADNHPLVYQQEYEAEFVSWAGEAFFSLDRMTADGKGVPLPQYCDYVFAVVDSALKDGSENDGTAVVWCARNSIGVPLTILDWDVVQINSDLLTEWMPGVIEKTEHWAKVCNARGGSGGVWIENRASGITLLQHGARLGWNVHPIDSGLTQAGKDARAIAASGPVWRGEVKLSAYAFDKTMTYKNVTKNHLVSQVCGYILGDKLAAKRADDLYDCFAYSVIVALGGPDGY